MLVTVDDLVKYMDISLSPKARESVGMILAGLQGALEAYLGRPIEIGTFTENIYIRPEVYSGSFSDTSIAPAYGSFAVPLKHSPVISVTSVYVSRVGGASVTPVLQFENRDYVLRPFGIDFLYPLGAYESLTVTYVAGMDGPEYAVFKHLILRAASREAQNMHDDNRGIQNMEAREVTPALPTGFTEEELNSVKRYRRQRI